MHTCTFFVAVVSLALLTGCEHGAEVGRVHFAGEGTRSTSLPLAAGEVDFWTDLAIEYASDASLHYGISLEQGGASVATATCDPLGQMPVKTSWVQNNLSSPRTRSGMGKMACSATLAKGGPTTIKASLGFDQKPTSASIRKADLVVKQ